MGGIYFRYNGLKPEAHFIEVSPIMLIMGLLLLSTWTVVVVYRPRLLSRLPGSTNRPVITLISNTCVRLTTTPSVKRVWSIDCSIEVKE